MSNVLKQLALAIGGVLFVVVLVMGFFLDVPLLVSVFRATIVMCVSSIILVVFFRFFAGVLYRYVAEQILQQRKVKKERAPGREPELANSVKVKDE